MTRKAKKKQSFIQNFLHDAKFSPKQGGGVQGQGSGRSGGLGGGVRVFLLLSVQHGGEYISTMFGCV